MFVASYMTWGSPVVVLNVGSSRLAWNNVQ